LIEYRGISTGCGEYCYYDWVENGRNQINKLRR
jgi:hypothetical protein